MRASFGVSTLATVVVPRSPRFRFVLLLLRMCCLNALPRRNFPVLVRLKRFAAPRCVLSFNFFGIFFSYKLYHRGHGTDGRSLLFVCCGSVFLSVFSVTSVVVLYLVAVAAFARPPPDGLRVRIVCI